MLHDPVQVDVARAAVARAVRETYLAAVRGDTLDPSDARTIDDIADAILCDAISAHVVREERAATVRSLAHVHNVQNGRARTVHAE